MADTVEADHWGLKQPGEAYTRRAFRFRLREAAETGIVLGVKYGSVSLIVLSMWAATGYFAWSKLETSVQQAARGQIAYQWLSQDDRHQALDAMVKDYKAKRVDSAK